LNLYSVSLFPWNKVIFPQTVLIQQLISILRKITLHIFLAANSAKPFVAKTLVFVELILLELDFLELGLSPIFLS
jgi:hypothetical protein